MQDAKTGGSRWVPDIREDEITEFQEQNGDETATYKAVNVHPIISRVLDKLAFFRTHVSAVWYNKLANKTVKDKLDEIDTSINSLNSRIIRAGTASGLKDGDTVDIGEPVDQNCIVLISPIYNSSLTRSCIIAAQYIGIGGHTFGISAYDTKTGATSTSTSLMIAYAVISRTDM